jgi:N-acetylmuramoyl-L-alanine amidase
MRMLAVRYSCKIVLWSFLLLPCLVFAMQPPKNPPAYKIKTIVLDAGHGGYDSGCRGVYSDEKAIALSITLRVGALINKYFPEIKVIYTRHKDEFVPLFERANIANRNNADLFLSIHLNALPDMPTRRGMEAYVMGLHKQHYNLAIAKRENDAVLLEKDFEQNYAGLDPESTEGHIILSMFQNAHLEQSILFAQKINQTFNKYTKLPSHGALQAGFVVLRATVMPSVLIEAGYLTNNSDENYLSGAEGQRATATAIFEGFKQYKQDMESQEK